MGLGLNLGFGGGSGSSSSRTSQVQRRQQRVGTAGRTTTSGTGTGQTATSYWTPQQQQLAGQLSGYLSGGFGGQTPWQQTGQAALTQAASGQGYKDIVDPATSEALYSAIEKQTMEDILPKATQAMAGQANLAGMLRSGPALQMQLNQRDQIVNELSKTLAGLRHSDESQRRGIEMEREGRQMPAAQSMLSMDPNQASINNVMQLLGIRGAATEDTTQTIDQTSFNRIMQRLKDWQWNRGWGGGDQSQSNWGFGLGWGGL